MFYRDGLSGIFVFGGIYAAGVLGWSVIDTGIFGILAIIAGAVFAFLGGRADSALGPKPVIVWTVVFLTCVATAVPFVSRDACSACRWRPTRACPTSPSTSSARSSGRRWGRCNRPRAR
jgi:MFS transporter, UMF1 family